MRLRSLNNHPKCDDTNHPHLDANEIIIQNLVTQIIHIWMLMYSLNNHPKYDDTNHPHLDANEIIIQNLITQINHIWMLM